MPFIIDGYNLLHFIQKASEDFGAITDVQLCRIISGYLKLINDKGEVVFDGNLNKYPFRSESAPSF